MLDELYDDVLSIMTEKGFTQWFERNYSSQRTSPLKWCYDDNGNMKPPKTPPKGINWLVNTYDNQLYCSHLLSIDDNGDLNPT